MKDQVIEFMRVDRSRRRNKKKRINRILFAVFLMALVVTWIISLMAYEENEVYRNESEFRKFADGQFKNSQSFETTEAGNPDYQYGELISYAVDYTDCEDEKIAEFRHKAISDIKKAYEIEIEASEKEKDDPDIHALILKTGIYESDNGVINLAIYEKGSVEDGKEMKTTHTKVHTYQFSKKTKDTLIPPQIFKADYRTKCSLYFTEYFMLNYDDDQFEEGWEQHLSASEDNFNKYIVTESGVTFFFDAGTVLKESEGEVHAGIATLQAEEILRDKIIERYIDPNKPMVALTYDDGPGLEAEERILDCLEENNVLATFFYQGVFIEGREDKIKRAAEMGCEIGNHTWSHPVLTSLTTSQVKKQFKKTNEAIYEACGQYPTVFRPSYGITDSKINKISGLPVIMWSLDTVDWESRNGKKVFNLVKKTKKLDGKIILLHSIHDSTADATELLIPWLKENGYQLVTVSELIKYKTGKDPVPAKVYK